MGLGEKRGDTAVYLSRSVCERGRERVSERSRRVPVKLSPSTDLLASIMNTSDFISTSCRLKAYNRHTVQLLRLSRALHNRTHFCERMELNLQAFIIGNVICIKCTWSYDDSLNALPTNVLYSVLRSKVFKFNSYNRCL